MSELNLLEFGFVAELNEALARDKVKDALCRIEVSVKVVHAVGTGKGHTDEKQHNEADEENDERSFLLRDGVCDRGSNLVQKEL